MANDFRIFVDAGCDIDSAYIKNGLVTMLTMSYSNGANMVEWTGLETDDDMHRFYDWQRNGGMTETTQLNKEDYEKAFWPLLRHGIGILYISLSSALSPSYYQAVEFKKAIERKYGRVPLYIVDSLSATGGIGIFAENAVMCKQMGYGLEQTAKVIATLSGKVHSWFYVNDLDYLRRNGKTSATKSMIGTLLGVKPILEISSDGKLRQIDKKFGSKKACEVLKDLYVSNRNTESNSTVYITHADSLETATRLRTMVHHESGNIEIKVRYLSPIIGAHTGPGIIALHHVGFYS